MAYVMRKNVGRIAEDHGHRKAIFHLKDALVGSVSGSLLVITGLMTFILYELDIVTEVKQKREKVLLMHFVRNIAIVSLMSVCTVIGCVVYRAFHVTQDAALRTNGQAFKEHPEVNTAVGLNSCSNKPNWKRKVLKEVCAFLLFSNVILWIMPAFGARLQFDHHVETHFFKRTMWTSIVNIGLPFGIFYRMHCIASLFEVYLMS